MLRRAFSRADVIVIVLVAGIVLAVIVLPRIQRVREDVVRTQYNNHVKQLAIAVHRFNDTYKRLPPAFDKSGPMTVPASVHVHLLPFLENDQLYDEYLRNGRLPENEPPLPVFFAQDADHEPDDRGMYAANLRVFSDKGIATAFDGRMPALAEIEPGKAKLTGTITDGTSNTILFTTKYTSCGAGGSRFMAAPNSAFAPFFGQNAALVKAHPSDATATFQLAPSHGECLISPLMAQSVEPAGLAVGMADGSVRSISPAITPFTWNSAVQPNDGNRLGDDW